MKFKELNAEATLDKSISKVGLSLGIVFSAEEIKRFKLKYKSIVRLDNAEVIKT